VHKHFWVKKESILNILSDMNQYNQDDELVPAYGLFVVRIETNCGFPPADLWWKKHGAQSLQDALKC
jgi:hypothetical protein